MNGCCPSEFISDISYHSMNGVVVTAGSSHKQLFSMIRIWTRVRFPLHACTLTGKSFGSGKDVVDYIFNVHNY
jgi:hypothetical protein